MIVKGITIHNSGNKLSAKEQKKILKDNGMLNYCHFLVDENDVVKTISLTRPAIHTGKGYDLGNMHTIAIEICRSACSDEIYFKAEEKAVELIKELMQKFNLTRSNIYFHNDFDRQMYCPHRILDTYKSKKNFLDKYF